MAVEVGCARRRFTGEEYVRMADVGILRRGERVELIRGEILIKLPVGPRHGAFVANINRLLVLGLGERATVWVQSTVRLFPDTMPGPDLAVLRRGHRRYKEAHPRPEDMLLVIEVAETSLAYDRRTKFALYASADILEYWVVDAEAEAIEVYREPRDQHYQHATRVAGSGTVSPLAFPDVTLRLSDVLA